MPTFSNRATLTYSGGTVTSNIVTGEIVGVLSAAKTALNETYETGDTVTYVISIVNSGAVPLSGLTVTDDLGAYTVGTEIAVPLEYVEDTLRLFTDGELVSTPAVISESPLTVNGISVPAGGSVLLIYQAFVTNVASPEVGGTVTNTAVISGGGISPITVSETVNVDEGTALTITKFLTPDTVVENGQITYTFIIANSGNTAAVATDDLVVTDLFDPILENITVTLDGETLTEGDDYTYDEATGLFTTVQSRITVPAAEFSQDPVTGEWRVTPGEAVLRITGNI